MPLRLDKQTQKHVIRLGANEKLARGNPETTKFPNFQLVTSRTAPCDAASELWFV